MEQFRSGLRGDVKDYFLPSLRIQNPLQKLLAEQYGVIIGFLSVGPSDNNNKQYQDLRQLMRKWRHNLQGNNIAPSQLHGKHVTQHQWIARHQWRLIWPDDEDLYQMKRNNVVEQIDYAYIVEVQDTLSYIVHTNRDVRYITLTMIIEMSLALLIIEISLALLKLCQLVFLVIQLYPISLRS